MDLIAAATILPMHVPAGEVDLVTYLLRVLVYLLGFGIVGVLAHWCVRVLEERAEDDRSTGREETEF